VSFALGLPPQTPSTGGLLTHIPHNWYIHKILLFCPCVSGTLERVGAAPKDKELLFWGDRNGGARTGTVRQRSRSSADRQGAAVAPKRAEIESRTEIKRQRMTLVEIRSMPPEARRHQIREFADVWGSAGR
jgi:hypothetical protein